jgi:glycosyltransferase involved in cell wall biosynthesis
MNPSIPLVSVVVIGRNEGERLLRCLDSVQAMRRSGFDSETIYVDSGSSDGSPDQARARGAEVIALQAERPSAALGRNAGWQAARGEFVLFLDGDTLLHPDFVNQALETMTEPDIAVVWGHRREIAPKDSIYNRVLDLDWIYPPGDSEFCGGDALMRRSMLAAVGGFDASLIAGEEPELCRRIRARGLRIRHIDVPMTGHDLAIHGFAGYWRRARRAGHAYAEVAERFRQGPDPLWQAEVRRNRIHGTAVLLAPLALLASLPWPALSLTLLLAGAGLWLRSAWRCRWKSSRWDTCLLYALHSHVQQVPILVGQLGYWWDRRQGRRRGLIEYKGASVRQPD